MCASVSIIGSDLHVDRFTSSDHYFIQPNEASQTLVIDRISRELNLVEGEFNNYVRLSIYQLS